MEISSASSSPVPERMVQLHGPLVRTKALANLEEEAGQRTIALAATFEFGFMKSEIYIRVNKGVLVIVLFNTFQDDSGRSNYLNREFFYRVGVPQSQSARIHLYRDIT